VLVVVAICASCGSIQDPYGRFVRRMRSGVCEELFCRECRGVVPRVDMAR